MIKRWRNRTPPLDLIRHHREAAARIAGARRFDQGVQREKVGSRLISLTSGACIVVTGARVLQFFNGNQISSPPIPLTGSNFPS